MAVGEAHVFPDFLTSVLKQLFFPKPPTTFLTCSSRGERRKYAGKKVRLYRGSNSQPPGHESDMLTWWLSHPGRAHHLKIDFAHNTMYQLENTMYSYEINSLPDSKILDWSKLKEMADKILKCM